MEELERKKLFIATRRKQIINSSSDLVSCFSSFLAKKLTEEIDYFSNMDNTTALPIEESTGKGFTPNGRPRTR